MPSGFRYNGTQEMGTLVNTHGPYRPHPIPQEDAEQRRRRAATAEDEAAAAVVRASVQATRVEYCADLLAEHHGDVDRTAADLRSLVPSLRLAVQDHAPSASVVEAIAWVRAFVTAAEQAGSRRHRLVRIWAASTTSTSPPAAAVLRWLLSVDSAVPPGLTAVPLPENHGEALPANPSTSPAVSPVGVHAMDTTDVGRIVAATQPAAQSNRGQRARPRSPEACPVAEWGLSFHCFQPSLRILSHSITGIPDGGP